MCPILAFPVFGKAEWMNRNAPACSLPPERLSEAPVETGRCRVGLTIIQTLLFAIGIYKWIVIAMVIFSWLYSFNVVNNSNRFVAMP